MRELRQEELNNISGGFSKLFVGAVIAGAVAFIIGVMDGFTRPLKCN